MDKILKSLLLEQGYMEFPSKKTYHKTFYIDEIDGVARAFSPALDKKSGKIAVSGLVGIIDFHYCEKFTNKPAGINIFGRHMLSLTSEWNLPWFIENSADEIKIRLDLIKDFLRDVPNKRNDICEAFRSGDLIKKKLILDFSGADHYNINTCV